MNLDELKIDRLTTEERIIHDLLNRNFDCCDVYIENYIEYCYITTKEISICHDQSTNEFTIYVDLKKNIYEISTYFEYNSDDKFLTVCFINHDSIDTDIIVRYPKQTTVNDIINNFKYYYEFR